MSISKEQLQSITPTLSSIIDGPLESLALNKLSQVFNCDEKDTESLLNSIPNNSKSIRKLKILDSELKDELDCVSILSNYSRDSREETSNERVTQQLSLSILFLTTYFLFLGILFYVAVFTDNGRSSGQEDLWSELQIFMGVLTAGVGQVLSFWFGPTKKY